jgi:hypothetical protein
MPFTFRPYRRFPVQGSVTDNADPFLTLSLAYFSGFWSLITLLFLSSAPVYAEWVPVDGNDQAGMAVAQLNRIQVLDHKPAAVVPVPQTKSWWTTQHEHTLARIRQGEVDLLLIGDSITHGWADEGRRIWDAGCGRRRAGICDPMQIAPSTCSGWIMRDRGFPGWCHDWNQQHGYAS